MEWNLLSSMPKTGNKTMEQIQSFRKSGKILHSGSRKTIPTLRDYQEQAIKKMKWALDKEGNDLIVMPVGSGKSIVIAHFAYKLDKDILILQPNKELLAQNYEKMSRYTNEIGIYSASFNKKEIKKFTFATIQSIYKIPEKFTHFDIVLVDEADLINPRNLNTMYQKFFSYWNPKVYGFTATPYRLETFSKKKFNEYGRVYFESTTRLKMINRYYPAFWRRMLYVLNPRDIPEYLAKLNYYDKSIFPINKIPVNKSRSDFDLLQYEKMIDIDYIIGTIKQLQKNHKSIIVFAPTINTAAILNSMTNNSVVIHSNLSKKERSEAVKKFKSGEYQVIYNVNILTAGFDHPKLDCIVLLRPTRSLRLYVQMLGRGARPGSDCDVIDMVGVVKSLGRLETIEVVKLQGGWDVITETTFGFHNKVLYNYTIQ